MLKNTSDNCYLNLLTTDKNPKAEFFGAVQIKKNYVPFHLMPIFYYPELLENISPELKKRMQGKSCFNFKDADEKLFKELNSLTKFFLKKYKSLKKL